MVDQEVKYIEVRGEPGPMKKTEAMKAYFSNFSVERRELIKEKLSERNKGTSSRVREPRRTALPVLQSRVLW